MRQNFAIVLAAVVSMSMTAALASDEARAPQRPHLDFVQTPANRLHLGMSAHEVAEIMGAAATMKNSRAAGANVCVLEFSGAIPSEVVLSNGSVARVALDVFHVDSGDLPEFGRRAWPGMSDSAVRRLLGEPTLVRHHSFFGIAIDHWVFSRAGHVDVSLFIRDSRVIARATGRDVPPRIFRVDLPSPRQSEAPEPALGALAGMTMDKAVALYGEKKFRVDYAFNGQSASRVVLETRAKGTYVGLTLVNGVVTGIEDLGWLPDDASFQGR